MLNSKPNQGSAGKVSRGVRIVPENFFCGVGGLRFGWPKIIPPATAD